MNHKRPAFQPFSSANSSTIGPISILPWRVELLLWQEVKGEQAKRQRNTVSDTATHVAPEFAVGSDCKLVQPATLYIQTACGSISLLLANTSLFKLLGEEGGAQESGLVMVGCQGCAGRQTWRWRWICRWLPTPSFHQRHQQCVSGICYPYYFARTLWTLCGQSCQIRQHWWRLRHRAPWGRRRGYWTRQLQSSWSHYHLSNISYDYYCNHLYFQFSSPYKPIKRHIKKHKQLQLQQQEQIDFMHKYHECLPRRCDESCKIVSTREYQCHCPALVAIIRATLL